MYLVHSLKYGLMLSKICCFPFTQIDSSKQNVGIVLRVRNEFRNVAITTLQLFWKHHPKLMLVSETLIKLLIENRLMIFHKLQFKFTSNIY
jgi:hypothetical protein